MRTKRILTILSLVAALMLVAAPMALAGGGSGRGSSPEQLADAGWTCVPAGPNEWIHCFTPANGSGSAQAIHVMVFSVTEEGVSSFLGTEILLSADVYNGQPCMTDGGDPYSYVSFFDSYACHHFDTTTP